MSVRSLDHVGVVVDDLEAATTFFLDLGLEREGAGSVEGQWVGNVIDVDDIQVESGNAPAAAVPAPRHPRGPSTSHGPRDLLRLSERGP